MFDNNEIIRNLLNRINDESKGCHSGFYMGMTVRTLKNIMNDVK